MLSSTIRTNRECGILSCKRCHDGFKHEETVALFKQHLYHLHCFRCNDCQKQLSQESFYLDEKLQFNVSNPQVYCELCYLKQCTSCSACRQILAPTSMVIECQGRDYHQECFLCSKCRLPLRDQLFYTKNLSFYCQQCMTELEPCIIPCKSAPCVSDQCKKCGKNFLAGEAISMYQYDCYHPDCFRCGHCQTFLVNQGFFRQEDGCFYCLNCHIDNGPHCLICQEPFLTGEILSQFDGKQFHSSCFLCDNCREVIETRQFSYRNGQVVCEFCLNK